MNIEQTNITAFLTMLLTPIIKDAIKANTMPVPPPPASEPPTERYIDTKEVMHLLGDVSSVSVWDWDKKGILKSYRIGNLKRFKLSEVLSSPKAIQRTKK
jgi:predicted DNA-binding transcriptional regulator AlpA